MESTLNLKTADTTRTLLLGKLWFAVSCCVFSQMTLVIVYVCIASFNLQIDQWFQSIVNVLTSLNTWLYLIPFNIISLAQIVSYGKEYLIQISYQRSRFQKYLSVLSVRTIFMCLLQMVAGGFSVWLYLSLIEEKNIIYMESEDKICLQEGSLFLLLNGVWVGLYYFIQVRARDHILIFPVIPRPKIIHFKSQLMNIINESRNFSIYPTVYFVIFYKTFGNFICQLFTHIFVIPVQIQDYHVFLYGFAWLFSTIYVTNINIMQFFFELFLTQPIEYSIIKTIQEESSLHEALLFDKIPVLQHLACLDFYLLSIWSPQRRQLLYTLSQPGGHPHTWNNLIQSVLKVISNFREPLVKTLDESGETKKNVADSIPPSLEMLSQTYFNLEEKYPNMRRIDDRASFAESPQIIEVESKKLPFNDLQNSINNTIIQKIREFVCYIRNLPSYKYLFDDLTEARVLDSFRNGQTIVWIVQGLANIVVKSFHEDPYGVIQKDLPVIITNLVDLKTTVEKLSKVSSPMKKGSNGDDFTRKMSNSISNATRRSLTNISRIYKDYLLDIPLDKCVRNELIVFS